MDDEIDVYGLTHPGKVRSTNQDHFLLCALQKHIRLYHTSLPDTARLSEDERVAFISVVADGVGGHAAGEEASRFALEGITRYISEAIHVYYTSDPEDDAAFTRLLEESALRVHNDLSARAARDEAHRGMATTLTLWLGVWPWSYLLQVGDSRCYSLRDGVLVQTCVSAAAGSCRVLAACSPPVAIAADWVWEPVCRGWDVSGALVVGGGR